MFGRLCVGVCALLIGLHTSAGLMVTPPFNLSLVTLNTNYTLTWDYTLAADVTFTTQYIQRYRLKRNRVTWLTACVESPQRSCDLTPFDLHYGTIHTLRVRANANLSQSEWVSTEFCPDEHADVGPPSSVHLSATGSGLDVFITDPLTSKNTSMKELVQHLSYQIVHWEKEASTEAEGRGSVNSKNNVVNLSDLKAWTWYCVSVQTHEDFYGKRSSFTAPVCTQTQGTLPWWQIVLFFLASVLIFFVLMLASICFFFYCYRTVKSTLCPPITLPKHLKQYLHDSPDIPRLLTPDSESELLCEVTICPEPRPLELHLAPSEDMQEAPNEDQEPDIRHNRQDSGSSLDSGVYSTGGSSSLRPRPSLACKEGGTSCQDTFDPLQLKMKNMIVGVKGQLEVRDEGVVDVSV